MTDIIKFNEEHTPKTQIGKMKFELAEALNTITDLQNPHKNKEFTVEQRHHLFNKSMRKVLDILDIDLDMHEMMKTGAEGFSYSDTEDDTEALEQLLSDKQTHDIKTKLFNLFTLAGAFSHLNTDFITVDDKGTETPATQQELINALRTNLVELTDSLGYSVDEVTENQTDEQEQPQGYDNLSAEDKLNVDMLHKLHEVQDFILKSGQTAVGVNRITTAVTILEAGLGVIDREEE